MSANKKARRDSQKGSTGSSWRQPNECPASETILVGRILANLDALRLACIERPSEDAFIKNAILFPIFNAGLEAAVLSRNPEWKIADYCSCNTLFSVSNVHAKKVE